MASYHLSVKTVSRATGRSGPGAAAYRTASRIECERDGTTHDYTRRSGVEASFIVAPDGAEWAQDRAALWNAVEAAEKRKDAKVAREYELALPHELAAEERRELAEGFAREVVARFGVAADVAIHAPHRHGDERNWHAHVLTTTRVAGAEGLGAKTRELDVVQTSGPAVEALRELWAVQVNHALDRALCEARVDHRSYARQGGNLVATQHMGPAAAGMERKAARRARDVPRSAQEPAQERLQEAPRAVPASMAAPRPVPLEASPVAPEAAARPSAGVSGAGSEPVTRIGQRNAEIQERNQVMLAARQALRAAQQVLEKLEAAARRVMSLARGLGAQVAAERAREASERAEAVRRAEQQAEQKRKAVELRQQAKLEQQRQEAAKAELDRQERVQKSNQELLDRIGRMSAEFEKTQAQKRDAAQRPKDEREDYGPSLRM